MQHNAVSELLYPTMKAEGILDILHWYGRDFKTLWVMLWLKPWLLLWGYGGFFGSNCRPMTSKTMQTVQKFQIFHHHIYNIWMFHAHFFSVWPTCNKTYLNTIDWSFICYKALLLHLRQVWQHAMLWRWSWCFYEYIV
jgi:hypothetical protein